MSAFSFRQAFGIYVAAALLTACGGGSQLGTNEIEPNAPWMTLARIDRASGSRPAPGRSWMAPEAKKTDLAYISNFYSSQILVFTYPRGNYVGLISAGVTDPQGLCATKTGNWWAVSSGSDQVVEYAHGGTTPLKTLSISTGEPAGFSVDPATGNLAVTILGTGDVVVFTEGSGSGKILSDDLDNTYFAAYDDKGDLFVDGFQGSTPALVELHKGGSTFVTITMSPPVVNFPGPLPWYRNYLAVGVSDWIDGEGIGHFAIHGRKAKEIGLTPGVVDVVEFWIQNADVVATDPGDNDAQIWKYPAGGSPIRWLSGSFDLPIGATVSVAK